MNVFDRSDVEEGELLPLLFIRTMCWQIATELTEGGAPPAGILDVP